MSSSPRALPRYAEVLSRLLATCQYEMPISSASDFVTLGSSRSGPSSLPWVYGEPNLVATTIHDYATKLFASVQRLDAILFDYFSRVHQWMPFISRQRFYGRLSRLSHTPDHSFVLLICCMHLILCIPPQVEKSPSRSVEYMEVKRLLALAESQGPLTTDLVQCGLIVALYEMNHGAFDESYMSLGKCTRVGIVLGLNQLQERVHASQDSLYVMSEEKRRTWWSVIILERYEGSPTVCSMRSNEVQEFCDCKDQNGRPLSGIQTRTIFYQWTTPSGINFVLMTPAHRLNICRRMVLWKNIPGLCYHSQRLHRFV